MATFDLPSWLQAPAPESPGMALARGVQSGAEIARGRNEDENQKSRNYMEMMLRSQENQRQAAMAPLQQAVESNRIKAQSVDIANSLQAQQEQLEAKEAFGGLARIMSAGRASNQLSNPEFEAHLWDYAADNPAIRKQPYFKNAMGDVKYAQSAKAAAAKQADFIQMRKDVAKIGASAKASKDKIYADDLKDKAISLRGDTRAIENARKSALDSANKALKGPADLAKINRQFDQKLSDVQSQKKAIDDEWQRRLGFHGIEGKGQTFNPDNSAPPAVPEDTGTSTPQAMPMTLDNFNAWRNPVDSAIDQAPDDNE